MITADLRVAAPGPAALYPAIQINEPSAAGLSRAWAFALNGNITAAAALANDCRFGRLELDLLWSFIYLLRDDGTRALAHAESARRWSQDANTTNLTDALRRCAFWLLGDLHAYNAAPKPVFAALGRRREHILQTFVRGVEAAVQTQQLRLGTAERLAGRCESERSVRRLPKEPFLLPAILATTLIYERGEARQAASRLRRLLPAVQAHGCVETAAQAYRTLARAASRLGQVQLALSSLREGECLARNKGWPRLALICITERIQILADLHRVRDAELTMAQLRELAGSPPRTQPHWHRQATLYWQLANSRLELVRNPTAATADSLRRLINEAVARGELKLAVEIGVRLAALLVALGPTNEALAVLEPILLASADAGLFQTVIDGGLTVRNLLLRSTPCASRPSHVDAYAHMLLDAWREPAEPFTGQRLPGPLTARECRILELIGLGNSNKLIARLLGIAPETVKSHTKRIFMRLDASTRAEAVSKAACLGIL